MCYTSAQVIYEWYLGDLPSSMLDVLESLRWIAGGLGKFILIFGVEFCSIDGDCNLTLGGRPGGRTTEILRLSAKILSRNSVLVSTFLSVSHCRKRSVVPRAGFWVYVLTIWISCLCCFSLCRCIIRNVLKRTWQTGQTT